MGDRGGGREPKGASLKKSKKNPGCAAARAKKAVASACSGVSAPPPVPVGQEMHFDCGFAILSRQFDRDRDRVLMRAKTDGNCCALLTWFSDIEKQTSLAELSKANTGFCYFITGVHPDNIDRTNKKSHDGWLEKTEELARQPECLGLLSGFNVSRDIGTHFAQESLLKSHMSLADKLMLPVVLHVPDSASLDKVIEILKSEGWATNSDTAIEASQDSWRRIIIHDIITACGSDISRLNCAVEAGCICSVSAATITDDTDPALLQRAKECVAAIPTEQLLVCSDAPWKTPQNIADTYLRTLRNEPANMEYIVAAIADCRGAVARDLGSELRANSFRIWGIVDCAAGGEGGVAGSVPVTILEARDEDEQEQETEQAPADLPTDSTATAEIADEAPAVSSSSSFYSCHRCRKSLFTSQAVSSCQERSNVRASTVFKVGEEGLCKSMVFLRTADNKEICARTSLLVSGGNVNCAHCDTKLGRFSMGELVCSCGSNVAGPVVRINSDKVDFTDGSVDAGTLADRARAEAAENLRLDSLKEALENEQQKLEAAEKRGKKVKKIRSKNRGNYSMFRDKSFIPGASRAARAVEGSGSGDAAHNDEADGNDSEEEDEKDEGGDSTRRVTGSGGAAAVTQSKGATGGGGAAAAGTAKSHPAPHKKKGGKHSKRRDDSSDEDEDS